MNADSIFLIVSSYVLLQCSVLGSILIVGGLYLVLWGKAKEEADVPQDEEDLGKESIPVTATGENEVKQGEPVN